MGMNETSFDAVSSEIEPLISDLQTLKLRISEYLDAGKRLHEVSDAIIALINCVEGMKKFFTESLHKIDENKEHLDVNADKFDDFIKYIPMVLSGIESTDAAKVFTKFSLDINSTLDKLVNCQEQLKEESFKLSQEHGRVSACMDEIKSMLAKSNSVLTDTVSPLRYDLKEMSSQHCLILDNIQKYNENFSIALKNELQSIKDELSIIKANVAECNDSLEIVKRKKGLIF